MGRKFGRWSYGQLSFHEADSHTQFHVYDIKQNTLTCHTLTKSQHNNVERILEQTIIQEKRWQDHNMRMTHLAAEFSINLHVPTHLLCRVAAADDEHY